MNGPLMIRILPNVIRWVDQFDDGNRLIARYGDLKVTIVGGRDIYIDMLLPNGCWKSVVVYHHPSMRLAPGVDRLKLATKNLLPKIYPYPSCPRGCHIPFGVIEIHDDWEEIRWTTWLSLYENMSGRMGHHPDQIFCSESNTLLRDGTITRMSAFESSSIAASSR